MGSACETAWVGIPCGSHFSLSVRPPAGSALQGRSEPSLPTARCLHPGVCLHVPQGFSPELWRAAPCFQGRAEMPWSYRVLSPTQQRSPPAVRGIHVMFCGSKGVE